MFAKKYYIFFNYRNVGHLLFTKKTYSCAYAKTQKLIVFFFFKTPTHQLITTTEFKNKMNNGELWFSKLNKAFVKTWKLQKKRILIAMNDDTSIIHP